MRKLNCSILILIIIICNIFGLTSGPKQPEFSTFEAVEASDLVNIKTGDFSWVLPLGDVKTPNGVGYPLSIHYQAGILHEQEASWVGLGWGLNTGAINRNVNSFPDDLCGDITLSYLYNNGEKGYSYTFGGKIGPISATSTKSWNSSEGYSYLPISTLSISASGKAKSGIGGSAGLHFDFRGEETSWGISQSVGYNGVGISLFMGNHSASGGVYSPLLSYSMSSNDVSTIGIGSVSISYSSRQTVVEKGITSYSNSFESSYFSSKLPFTFQFNDYGWLYSNLQYGEGYGYLYKGASPNKSDNLISEPIITSNEIFKGLDIGNNLVQKTNNNSSSRATLLRNSGNTNVEFIYPKQEYAEVGDYLAPTQDMYLAAGQGMKGIFKPFAKNPFHGVKSDDDKFNGILGIPDGGDGSISNPFTFNELFNKNSSIGEDFSEDKRIVFKMLGEMGLSIVDDITENSTINYTGDSYNNFSDNAVQGVKITPVIGIDQRMDFRSKLQGFIIRDQQGKTYYYTKPIYSLQEVYYTSDKKEVPAVSANGTFSFGSDHGYRASLAPFAYTWLLTAVTGPDYVKKNIASLNGSDYDGSLTNDLILPHDGDLGYWVKFNYEYGRPFKSDVDNSHLELAEFNTASRLDKASYLWRMPYFDSDFDQTNLPHIEDKVHAPGTFSSSFGMKEITYLKSIETASEIAYFETSFRKDGRGVDLESYPKFVPAVMNWSVNNYQVTVASSDDHYSNNVFPVKNGSLNPSKNDCQVITVSNQALSAENFWDLDNGTYIGNIRFQAKATWYYPVIWGFQKDGDVGPHLRTGDLFIRKDTSGCLYSSDHSIINNLNAGLIEDDADELGDLDWEAYYNNSRTAYAKCVYAEPHGIDSTKLYVIGYCGKLINGTESKNYPKTGIEIAEYWYIHGEPSENEFKQYTTTPSFVTGFLSGGFHPYRDLNPIVRTQKKLDRISWYSKNSYPFLGLKRDPSDGQFVEYYQSPDLKYPRPYKQVDFNYDYSLAKNTPNSNAENKGRLTLKSISFSGSQDKGNGETVLPPYKFDYQNSNEKYDGFDMHDPWGYKKESTYSDLEEYTGINWNLSSIIKPSGGKIEIKYSRDNVNSEVGTFLRMLNTSIDSINSRNGIVNGAGNWKNDFFGSNIEERYITAKGNIPSPEISDFPISPEEYEELRYAGGDTIWISDISGLKPGMHIIVTKPEIHKYGGFKSPPYYKFAEMKYYASYEVLAVNRNGGANAYMSNPGFIVIDGPIDKFDMPYPKKSDGSVLFFKEEETYCGDIKVDNITLTDVFGEKVTQHYEYSNGYFPSINKTIAPKVLTDKIEKIYSQDIYRGETFNNVKHTIVNSKPAFSSFVGLPQNVSYSIVNVFKTGGKTGTSRFGKVEYNFYDKNDRYSITGTETDLYKQIKFDKVQYNTSSDVNKKTVIDRSGIIGLPKNVIKYDNSDKQVFKKELKYAFSENVEDQAGVYFDNINNVISTSSNMKIGLSQERVIKRVKEHNYDVKNITDIVISKPYLIEVSEQVNNIENKQRFGMFDARTGNSSLEIATLGEKEKGNVQIPYHAMPDISTQESSDLDDKNKYNFLGGIIEFDAVDYVTTKMSNIDYATIIGDIDMIKKSSKDFYSKIVYPATTSFGSAQTVIYNNQNANWKGTGTFSWPSALTVGSNWHSASKVIKMDFNMRINEEAEIVGDDQWVHSVAVWHPIYNKPLSIFKNAEFLECGFLSGDYDRFEENNNVEYIDLNSGWERAEGNESGISDPVVSLLNGESPIAQSSIYVKNAFGPTRNFMLKPNTDYTLSAWIKSVNGIEIKKDIVVGADYRNITSNDGTWPLVVGNSIKSVTESLEKKEKKDGWFLVELLIPASKDLDWSGGANWATRVWIGAPNGGEILINDIRFYPKDALVKSFYYDIQTTDFITSVDENGNIKSFEYNNLGELKNIKNNSGEVLTESKKSYLRNKFIPFYENDFEDDSDKEFRFFRFGNPSDAAITKSIEFEGTENENSYQDIHFNKLFSSSPGMTIFNNINEFLEFHDGQYLLSGKFRAVNGTKYKVTILSYSESYSLYQGFSKSVMVEGNGDWKHFSIPFNYSKESYFSAAANVMISITPQIEGSEDIDLDDISLSAFDGHIPIITSPGAKKVELDPDDHFVVSWDNLSHSEDVTYDINLYGPSSASTFNNKLPHYTSKNELEFSMPLKNLYVPFANRPSYGYNFYITISAFYPNGVKVESDRYYFDLLPKDFFAIRDLKGKIVSSIKSDLFVSIKNDLTSNGRNEDATSLGNTYTLGMNGNYELNNSNGFNFSQYISSGSCFQYQAYHPNYSPMPIPWVDEGEWAGVNSSQSNSGFENDVIKELHFRFSADDILKIPDIEFEAQYRRMTGDPYRRQCWLVKNKAYIIRKDTDKQGITRINAKSHTPGYHVWYMADQRGKGHTPWTTNGVDAKDYDGMIDRVKYYIFQY